MRVVVENHDELMLDAQVEMLRAAALDAVGCLGPHSFTDRACPLVTLGECELVDDADVIFVDLDLDVAEEAAVLDELRAARPHIPVVVELPASTVRRHADRLDGCTVVPPFDPGRLIDGIRAAAERGTA